MIRIPIGNERSMRVEVRSVAPDANPYLVMLSIFKTGLEGSTAKIKNLRQAERYLPTTSTKPSPISAKPAGPQS